MLGVIKETTYADKEPCFYCIAERQGAYRPVHSKTSGLIKSAHHYRCSTFLDFVSCSPSPSLFLGQSTRPPSLPLPLKRSQSLTPPDSLHPPPHSPSPTHSFPLIPSVSLSLALSTSRSVSLHHTLFTIPPSPLTHLLLLALSHSTPHSVSPCPSLPQLTNNRTTFTFQ